VPLWSSLGGGKLRKTEDVEPSSLLFCRIVWQEYVELKSELVAVTAPFCSLLKRQRARVCARQRWGARASGERRRCSTALSPASSRFPPPLVDFASYKTSEEDS